MWTWTASTPTASPTALRVLAEVEHLPPEHPDAVAVRRAIGRLFKTVKEQRRAERRSAIRANDEAVTAATATGAPGRIDDETQGLALSSSATGRAGGHARSRPRVLRLQAALPGRRRVLPPALSRLRRAQPRAPRRAHRPDRAPRAAHRRAGEDRDVHRAAPAARRGAHDDHDALPARRGPALRRDGGQRRLDRPAARRRRRPARPGPGHRARGRGRRPGPARHPHQQRRADRAPLARGVRAPGRRRAGAAAERAAAGGRDARALGSRPRRPGERSLVADAAGA